MTEEQTKFLKAYIAEGSISMACRAVKISEHTVSRWRKEAEDFNASLSAAKEARKKNRRIVGTTSAKMDVQIYDLAMEEERTLISAMKDQGIYKPIRSRQIFTASVLMAMLKAYLHLFDRENQGGGSDQARDGIAKMILHLSDLCTRIDRGLGLTNESKERKESKRAAASDFFDRLMKCREMAKGEPDSTGPRKLNEWKANGGQDGRRRTFGITPSRRLTEAVR